MLRNYNQLLRIFNPSCRNGRRCDKGFNELSSASESSPNKGSTSPGNFDLSESINCPALDTKSGYLFKSCDWSFCDIRHLGNNAVRIDAVQSSACPSVVCSDVTEAESKRQCILDRCCGTEVDVQSAFSRPVPVKRNYNSPLAQCIHSRCRAYAQLYDKIVCIVSSCHRPYF